MQPARSITQHVTENLPALPLFFDTWPSATSSRLENVGRNVILTYDSGQCLGPALP